MIALTSLLKIALFTYSTKPRGGVIHTLELAEALHKIGHQVCVYTLDKDGTGFERHLACEYCLIPAKPVAGDMDALIEQRIQEFVDYLSSVEFQFDCYHAQDCISANALEILRNTGQIPHFVRTVHHIDAFNSPYLQACQDRSIIAPDRCLCVSQYWQQELQKRYQVQAIRVINGINTERFSPLPNGLELPLKQQLGLIKKPIYLTVGGIEPRKNTITLLKAFIQVLQIYPQAQLIIAGGATLFDYQSYRDEFFAFVEQSNIQIGKSLILPGVISDERLSALYRIADGFVFPSVKEGWGLVILEAIASCLPVITANQPPFTEFLSSHQALLIDPNSPDAIAQAMIALTSKDLSQKLVRESQPICHQYTWETSAKMHLNIYHQLLETHARNSFSD